MKGQEWIGGLFSLLLAGVIAGVALPAILPSQALKVTPEVETNEFENKAILLANLLMSNSNLVYSDLDGSYQRGVFDKIKLDSIRDLIEKDPAYITFYPETYALVTIMDMDSVELSLWWFEVKDDSENVIRFLECREEIEAEVVEDPIRECAPNRFSVILGNAFPVAIRYPSDDMQHPEIHKSLLFLTVVE